MKKIDGDLIALALKGAFDVIIHGCNCQNTMGAGIALQIKRTFPGAFEADQKTLKGDRSKLGSFSSAQCPTPSGSVIVVNAYTQYDWKGFGRKADYNAIDTVFVSIAERFDRLRIGYPAIGVGLAGGDWTQISQIIDSRLEGQDHTLVVYQGKR